MGGCGASPVLVEWDRAAADPRHADLNLGFSPRKAMRDLTDAKRSLSDESKSIEIGGVHEQRRSNRADQRS